MSESNPYPPGEVSYDVEKSTSAFLRDCSHLSTETEVRLLKEEVAKLTRRVIELEEKMKFVLTHW